MSSLLVCRAPWEPEALSCFHITFGVPGYFANLPVSSWAYLSHHFSLSSCSLTGAVSRIWAGNLLCFQNQQLPSLQLWTQPSYFLLGEETGKALLSPIFIPHSSAQTCYLYHGILSGSGNHRFLFFLHLSQHFLKTMSSGVVPDWAKWKETDIKAGKQNLVVYKNIFLIVIRVLWFWESMQSGHMLNRRHSMNLLNGVLRRN